MMWCLFPWRLCCHEDKNKMVVKSNMTAASADESELVARLADADFSGAKLFQPMITYGRVVSVHDGDTMRIGAFVGGEKYLFNVRVNGIDAPEVHPKRAGRTEESLAAEKIVGERAREVVADMVLGRVVHLSNLVTDSAEKYGRILADVSAVSDGIDVAGRLLEMRLAVKYEGDTKEPPADWIAYSGLDAENVERIRAKLWPAASSEKKKSDK